MKLGRFILVAVLLAVLCIGVALLVPERPPASPPLPNPNGYDDLVKAGTTLVGDPGDYPNWTEAQLAEFVNDNSETYELIEAGLSAQSRAPTLTNQQDLTALFPRVATFKQLAQALGARARLANQQGHYQEAAATSLAGMELAHAITRGGVLIEGLVGISCEAHAQVQFRSAITNLDATTTRQLVRQFAELDATAPTVQEIMDNERAYSTRVSPTSLKVVNKVRRIFGGVPIGMSLNQSEAKLAAAANNRRRLLLQTAVRAFQLEHGRDPTRADELVPDYLVRGLKDETTGAQIELPQ